MQSLQDMGFDTPKSEDDDSQTDPAGAAEFTQAWSHNPEEGALASFVRDGNDKVAMATLTWTVGTNLPSLEAVAAVKQVVVDLSHALGPVHAVLDQTAAWVSAGGAGASDEIAASACWSREPIASSGSTLNVSEYLDAKGELKSPIGFSAVLEQSASKKWNVIGSLSA